MSVFQLDTTAEFKKRLLDLSREELLEIIADQNPKYIEQIAVIENAFRYRLRHLTWPDGSPVEGKDLTNEELASLIDPPFLFDKEIARKWGLNEDTQRQIHFASDPVLWARHMLDAKVRVYQALVLRHPSINKVMRFGRRAGKTYTLAVFMLWYAYTHKDGRIIVMTPMKAQSGLIYDEILKLAKKNSIVMDSVSRNVSSPQYEINFTNGTTIRLFTTGMKSGSKSDVVRGQEGHVIILDEMDYMGEEDLVAVIPMLQKTEEDQEDKIVIAASTPTGQRQKFWDWNHDPTFAAFWFPSYCNPNWDALTEQRIRSEQTEMQFRHEIEADWGEDASGVYPKRLVDIAFNQGDWKYDYSEVRVNNTFYVFGIDWDKYGAGVNIVVLQFCKENYSEHEYANKIKVAYREEITKEEFLLHKAVDRIVELNRIFRPKHIYADQGYGEMQMEHLHMYGKEHPESGLHKIAKAWAFNETIEVPDPYSHVRVKKDLKPFMVDNLRYMLEQEKIVFPNSDDDLYLQLISYIVIRTSMNNRPVFGPGGSAPDHAHDALLLAAFAIAYNYDDLLNPNYAVKAMAVSNDTFLPLFSVDSEKDKAIAQDMWDGSSNAPVYTKRRMAYGARRSSTKNIKRKMF